MTGILGGTFDPPHFGHLVLALEALDRFGLQKVLLVPSRFPPHKKEHELSSFRHRFLMTELAACDSPELEAADLEPVDGPSWTVNLIQKLKDQGKDICFIIGMDSLEELHTWKDPQRISELCRIVAGTRPGYDSSSAEPGLLDMVETFVIPGMHISSSDLRNRFARGRNTRYLLPEKVIQYIRENDLYARRKGRR